jgi:2'-5' RNA ligase
LEQKVAMPHRLFVGLRPPPDVRLALLGAMRGIDSARWQDEAQLHLTLRFIGETATPAANDLAAALSSVAAPRFELTIGGVGTFDRKGSPSAVWARIAPSLQLEALRRKIDHACERSGLVPDPRKFVPHITLARLNQASGSIGDWLSALSDMRIDPWPVDGFILYESHLGAEGSHYEPVARYALRTP